MHPPSARHKSIPIAINPAAVIARAVSIVIADAGAYCSSLVRRSVFIVGRRIGIIVVTGRVIRGWIVIAAIIRRHVRTLRASAQKSRDRASAKD